MQASSVTFWFYLAYAMVRERREQLIYWFSEMAERVLFVLQYFGDGVRKEYIKNKVGFIA